MHRETLLGGCPWHRPLWKLAGGGIARGDAEARRGEQELCVSASLRAALP